MSHIARHFAVSAVLDSFGSLRPRSIIPGLADDCRAVRGFTVLATAALAAILSLSGALFAQGEKPQDAYQSAWNDVSELLRRREYGSAIAKLESLAEERDLRDYGKQIEADKKAIARLQVLERIVLEQAAKLGTGSTIELSGISYTVVSYEKSSKGDALILKSKSLGKEAKKLITDLPSGTWMELAEADLESLDNSALTLGIFLGFDRIADRKAARKLLNEAASQGADVTPWLARLDATEAKKKGDPKGDGDPIIGKWSGRFGPPQNSLLATYEFKKDGSGVMTVDPKVLNGFPRFANKTQLEFEQWKRDVRRMTFKWEKKEDKTYRMTLKIGITVDGLSVSDDLMSLPGYHDFIRQVDR